MSYSVLLVGGAGFVGSWVCRMLRRLGHKVAIVDSFSPSLIPDGSYVANMRYRKDLWNRHGATSVFRGSAADFGFMASVFTTVRPDLVIDMAALPVSNVAQTRRHEAMERGISSLTTLLEVCHLQGANCPARFVYISSSMVYGDFECDPVLETSRTEPHTIYGALKLAGEHITRAYCKMAGMAYTIVRPSAIYGPADNNHRVIQKFLTQAIRGDAITVRSGKDMVMDFTYVTDAAEGIVLAATKEWGANEVFNITRGRARHLDEVVSIIKGIYPLAVVQQEEDTNKRPRRGALSVVKAKKLLDYAPGVDIETAIPVCASYLEQVLGCG